MLQYCRETREVQLVADRSYRRGEPITAWCGPQPNRRLLLNYGIVTDDNPYDRLALTVTLPHADSLFQAKRAVLQQHKLATQQTFQLQRGKVRPPAPAACCKSLKVQVQGCTGQSHLTHESCSARTWALLDVSQVSGNTDLSCQGEQPETIESALPVVVVILTCEGCAQGLPEMLLPYLRLAHCTDSESLKQASLDTCCSAPISAENELTVLHQLASHLQNALSRCVSALSASSTIRLCFTAPSHGVHLYSPADAVATKPGEVLFQAREVAVPRRYRTTAEEDEATIASSSAGPRQKVAARLLRIEKEILNGTAPMSACFPPPL